MAFPDGSPYEPTRAWRDLFNAINNAQKFIYITGWSVFTDIQLVRGDEDPDGESNVGELLKKKADEGVRVLMMVWNEKTSNNLMEGATCALTLAMLLLLVAAVPVCGK